MESSKSAPRRSKPKAPPAGSSGPRSPELFLSYHRPDLAAVRAVQKLLEARSVATYLDVRDLPAGLPWPQRLEEALGSVRAVAVFLGPTGLGRGQKREIGFALDRQDREERFPVIPVLLQGARPELSFLFHNTWVDLRDDPTSPEGMRALVEAAQGKELARRTEILTGFCPFLGLRAFGEEDAAFFCGREKFTNELLQMILNRDLVAVLGASGSGKSSVIHAGLLPALRRQRPPAATWDAISFTPKGEPFHQLATSVLPLLEPDMTETDRIAEARKLAKFLADGQVPLGDFLGRVLAKSHGTDRLLLIGDQFEELLTLTPGEQQRPFMDMLLKARAQGKCSLLLSLRGEFYGRVLDLSRELSDRLGQGVINVGPMTRDELEKAIVGPAERVGLEFEAGLVTDILNDATGQPGNLPLLEFALTELCQERGDNLLTHARYEEIGRVVGAIAQKADRIFNSFDPEHQQITKRLFTQLVRVTQPEEGTIDTRRRALRPELGPWAETAAGDEVIRKWADERLITTTGGGQAEEPLGVELAHEALLREWPELAGWITKEREDLLTHRWLADQAAAWEKDRHDPSYLLSGTRLERAQEWAKRHAEELAAREREFLQDSRTASELAEQRRREQAQALLDEKTARAEAERQRAEEQAARAEEERLRAEAQTLRYEEEREHTRQLRLSSRKLRRALMLLIVALFIVAGLAFYSNFQKNRATWRNLLLGSKAALGSQPEVSLLLALEALRLTTDAPEAEGTLRQSLANVVGKPLGNGESQATAASPDHRWLATAGADGTVRRWDLMAEDPAKNPAVVGRQKGRARKVAVSSDGRFVATYTKDDQDQARDAVRVWNLQEKAKEPFLVRRGEDWLGSTPFSPDGRWLVTREFGLVVRDLNHPKQPLHGLAGTPTALAFVPHEPWMITSDRNGSVTLWDLSSPTAVRTLPVRGCEGELGALEIDFNGRWLLGWGGSACLWNLMEPAAAPRPLPGPDWKEITAATFSHDSRWLFTAREGKVMRWDLPAADHSQPLWERKGAPITLLAPSANGRWLVTGGEDQAPRLLDITKEHPGDPDEPRVTRTPGDPFTAIALSPDGGSLAAGREDGKIFRRDLERQTAGLVTLQGREPVTALAFSPDRRFLASGGKEGGILLWDLARKPPTADALKHEEKVSALVFSPDNRWLVAGGADKGATLLWKLSPLEPAKWSPVNHPGGVTALAFSRDGKWLATAGADGKARIWPFTPQGEAEPKWVLPQKGPVTALVFSAQGTPLITGGADGSSRLWDLAQPEAVPRPPLVGHGLDVLALALSPDGHHLASGSRDLAVRLWDLGQQGAPQPSIVLPGHPKEIRAVAFNPDGHWLVSADASGTVRRWNLRLDEVKRLACEKAGRNLTKEEWKKYLGTGTYRSTCPNQPSEP
ncbi:MAG TPA: TIR domain-containing protein [Thermoanaerobaculia bacterium]|nr:TIR domain-containing protein [Thermoanaerobaculia bacterium]